MLHQTDLRFLREKIQDLKHAIFFSENTSLLRMATTIVTLSKIDELGQLWFFVPRPQQSLQEFDREFPVRLEFFKKGRQFFLHMLGKAFIVTDPEEINSLVHEDIREQTADHLVLIKVRMTKADYFETPGERPRPAKWWREVRNQVHGWLSHSRPAVAWHLNR
ncbi:MAG TPA: pyridoxamine 5'-phosphate oxidase family protein [Puia sp.]|nr:pyridoxamine 5'-phosphate oxidase family protein [Puia sp.]